MDRDVQTLYNPPCVCRISADIQCLWCPDAGIHPGRWCTCQVQWILRYPAVVPRGDGRYIRGTVGICVGCLGREIDRDRTATQRLDIFTDLFDRLTVSIMRHMGAWTRTDRGRPVPGGGDEPPTDMTTTVESEMHGIIALSSSVDDRFRDSARVRSRVCTCCSVFSSAVCLFVSLRVNYPRTSAFFPCLLFGCPCECAFKIMLIFPQ